MSFPDELAEREALIEYNRQREKTFSQKMREADELKAIYTARAKARMIATQNNDTARSATENFPEQVDSDKVKGETRDIIARKVGIGSGRSYDNGDKVWQAAKAGDKVAKELVEKIDKGEATISGAAKSQPCTYRRYQGEGETFILKTTAPATSY